MLLINSNTFVDVLSVFVGILFITAGGLKLFGNYLEFWKWAKQGYLKNNPLRVYYASGIIEVATGIGLLIPSFRFAAVITR